MRTVFHSELSDRTREVTDVPVSTRPSPGLLESLVSLISATHRLGLSRRQLQEKRVLRDMLEQFSKGCFQLVAVDNLQLFTSTPQRLWDVIFLRCLCRESGLLETGEEIGTEIQARVSHYSPSVCPTNISQQLDTLMGPKLAKTFSSNTESAVSQAFPRFQLLLSPFLIDTQNAVTAPNASSLLPRGVPASESTAAPTIVLAKPSPRFGLLLVPGSARTTLR